MTTLIKVANSRLDVVFKIEYAWAYKNNLVKKNNWFYELYKEHIRAINDFSELNNNKNNFTDFLVVFNSLIEEFNNKSWDNRREKIELSIDGSIRNGSHRFALTKLYGTEFCETIVTKKKPLNYNFYFFLRRGLKIELCLYAFERYLFFSNSCHPIVLFPSTSYNYLEIQNKIKQKFNTLLIRDVDLNSNGVHNLVLHMYRDQEWLSLERNQGYSATLRHAQQRYVKGMPIKILFVESDDLDKLHEFKKEIRNELNKGNFPIHVPDTREEVLDLAGLVLRKNGINFLNFAKPKNNKKVHQLLKAFLNWTKKENHDIYDFCVVGSAYVSLEGHREVNDLDIFDLKFRNCPIKNINILKKDSEWLKFYSYDTFFSPINCFFYNGIRILSRSKILKFKNKRATIKDKQDINYLRTNDEKSNLKKTFRYFFGFILESSFGFLVKVRTVTPKPIKRIIRYLIKKIFK